MLRIVSVNTSFLPDTVAVIRAVHDEYGFTWDEHGYHRDLYDIDKYYFAGGGGFWVLLDDDRVVATAGLTLHGDECELHRLYLLREYRGAGWGRRLLETTMEYGGQKGCRRMIAWSDVTLTDAHRLYRKTGFTQEGERQCDDPDNSREYGFWRSL